MATHKIKPDQDLEEQFAKHVETAARIKTEYDNLYRDMVAKLSPSDLEPFEKVLQEHKCHIKNPDAVIESLRRKLLNNLAKAFDTMWDDLQVTNSIASLEMVKEKCKQFEGIKWEIYKKTPEERLLPTRGHFMELRIRYMQKQLDFQNSQLKDLKESVEQKRSTIHEIVKQRVYLQEIMKTNAERFKTLQEAMVEDEAIETFLGTKVTE